QSDNPLRKSGVISQGRNILAGQISRTDCPIPPGHSGCQGTQLGRGQNFSIRISKMAGQEEESLFPGSQRNLRLGGAGVFTTSGVSVPSGPRHMGATVNPQNLQISSSLAFSGKLLTRLQATPLRRARPV